MTEQLTNAAPLAHSIANACRRIGICRTFLYALTKSGEIATFKVGTRTLVLESELQRFVASRAAA